MTKAEAAKATLEVLEKRGWRQGAYETDDDPCCLLDAIWEAGGYAEMRGLDNAIRDKIAAETGMRSIVKWNDIPGRTYPEVKALLESFQ